MPAGTLWTIGHSTRPWDVFEAMLAQARIAVLADVRRFAGSRRNPQFSRDAMPAALAAATIAPVSWLGSSREMFSATLASSKLTSCGR